ncbi:DNA methyltransferase [Trueperella sp. HMSC08B05]|uniref:Site-specific DNA-methyltransferase n=1 Tax=Trueperella bernardiae TaxID=59561 RepID=A0AAW6ZJ55_9ACTO|nr:MULTISPECIES: site-specific DNA-methyltransferase [Trueperella]MDK8601691.1 site-specific DNA-methyltransferase [Trueperella bernardiae]OFS67737.1 DNA methyltransferase [Trueperella sp. HMSC08H06]OFS76725.1 DNA methyltransferase [Trueperella sp. HMSC08B05]
MDDTTKQVPGITPDFATEAAERLAELFPEVIADGKADVEKLKVLLGDDVEDARERFGLFWPGKTRAIRAAQTPTTSTLMPDKENSVDWDTTQNVFIEGDNLEVLKILQKHYYGQIKMIYIDPPYNTGNDFVYADDYADSIGNYLELTGQTDEGGKLSTNSESSGRFHSNWLNMMYPRLKLARNLLTQDGLIFISIDESEVDRLTLITNEIFGEHNVLGKFVWRRRQTPDSRNSSRFSLDHDYVLVIGRTVHASLTGQDIDQGKYSNPDNDPRGPWMSVDLSGLASASQRPNLHYDLVDPETGFHYPPNPNRGWSKSRETMQTLLDEGRILFPKSPDGRPREKKFLRDLRNSKTGFSSLLEKKLSNTNTEGAREVRDLLGGKIFDFPKPLQLLKTLIAQGAHSDSLVLDFFAGSGTTAHAVLTLNAEDGGNRRCISVQLPEPTDEKSEAYKAGYETISEITRERIRRASKKILEEEASKLDGQADSLDIGFRAYKLVDTNFTKWKADSGLSEGDLIGLFSDLADSADDHARPEALLTEVLLKLGFSLTEKIEIIKVAGLSVFSVADGLVMAYLDEHTQPTLDQLRALVAKEPERLVVLEDAFQGNDELKTNLVQECRTRNVDLWTA